tara:strand:+ start:137 stop:346 length:210 start_codon:yes stop_codon:yes gene_type:complete
MKLSPHEIGTPLWVKLSEHYTARIAKLRARLEARIDESETARIRAQIAEIKEFFDLAEPDRKRGSDAGE